MFYVNQIWDVSTLQSSRIPLIPQRADAKDCRNLGTNLGWFILRILWRFHTDHLTGFKFAMRKVAFHISNFDVPVCHQANNRTALNVGQSQPGRISQSFKKNAKLLLKTSQPDCVQIVYSNWSWLSLGVGGWHFWFLWLQCLIHSSRTKVFTICSSLCSTASPLVFSSCFVVGGTSFRCPQWQAHWEMAHGDFLSLQWSTYVPNFHYPQQVLMLPQQFKVWPGLVIVGLPSLVDSLPCLMLVHLICFKLIHLMWQLIQTLTYCHDYDNSGINF